MNRLAMHTKPFPFTYTSTLGRLLRTTKPIVVARGGTRSGKTYAILQMLAHWLMTGVLRDGEYIPEGKALVVRKEATTVKETVLEDFEKIMSRDAIIEQVHYDRTSKIFTYGERKVSFIGADKSQKQRGKKSVILYCNEANELNYGGEFFELSIRCEGPVFIDFNPTDPYVWIKEELEDKRQHQDGDVDVEVFTFKDNEWISPKTKNEILRLKDSPDPTQWRVHGLGEYGSVEGLIIPKLTIINTWPNDLRWEVCGMDFGFSNDPTALYRVGLKVERDGSNEVHKLYCDELIYETGLVDSELVARMRDLKIEKRQEIIADPSHPITIETLRRAGFNVRRAIKRPGSVRSGISLLRSYKIFATARSQGIIKEQRLWKFKRHINGNYTNAPIDGNDHAFDCLRYVISRYSQIKTF